MSKPITAVYSHLHTIFLDFSPFFFHFIQSFNFFKILFIPVFGLPMRFTATFQTALV